MIISMKGRYALRGMLNLAMRKTGDPVPIKSISQMEDISEHFLEQLFIKLKKAGLVRSVRGPSGGYLLKRHPSKITVGDVLRSVEGSLSPSDCTEIGDKGHCVKESNCAASLVWHKLNKTISDFLDSHTLEDFCKEAQILNQNSKEVPHNFTFNI